MWPISNANPAAAVTTASANRGDDAERRALPIVTTIASASAHPRLTRLELRRWPRPAAGSWAASLDERP
jgi:hypothetical protein